LPVTVSSTRLRSASGSVGFWPWDSSAMERSSHLRVSAVKRAVGGADLTGERQKDFLAKAKEAEEQAAKCREQSLRDSWLRSPRTTGIWPSRRDIAASRLIPRIVLSPFALIGSTYGVTMRPERCRLCGSEAIFVAVLHDGARVPYCFKHFPQWYQLDEKVEYENLVAAIRRYLNGYGRTRPSADTSFPHGKAMRKAQHRLKPPPVPARTSIS
jgi:hypothetical protein